MHIFCLQENSGTESEISTPTSEEFHGTPVPFEDILKGVIAFVEVISDEGDRSEVVKSMMRAMGATVRDTFSRDITHVIFRDGTYQTFEKAKLVKAKMVSVLWLEATKRYRFRVPESKYPALGIQANEYNVSFVCQKMQKDYDSIVQNERKRRSEIRRTQSHVEVNVRRRTVHGDSISRHNSSELCSDMDSISNYDDIIPPSQKEWTIDTRNRNISKRRNSFQLTDDESIPVTTIKDSLELQSCIVRRTRENVLFDEIDKSNSEESLHLHVTTDESNVTNNRKSDTSATKSFEQINNMLADKSINETPKTKTNDTSKTFKKPENNLVDILEVTKRSEDKSDDFLSLKPKIPVKRNLDKRKTISGGEINKGNNENKIVSKTDVKDVVKRSNRRRTMAPKEIDNDIPDGDSVKLVRRRRRTWCVI